MSIYGADTTQTLRLVRLRHENEPLATRVTVFGDGDKRNATCSPHEKLLVVVPIFFPSDHVCLLVSAQAVPVKKLCNYCHATA